MLRLIITWAVLSQNQGKLRRSHRGLQKGRLFEPAHSKAQYNMGNAFKEQGKLEEAMEAYSKALSIKPDLVAAWNNGAEALEKWNKLDELAVWLEKAFKSFETVPAELNL